MRTLRLAFGAFIGGAIALVACNGLTGASALQATLEDEAGASTSSGGSSSGSPIDDGGGGADVATDSPVFDSSVPLVPVDIVDVGTADKATGLSGGQHLVWAPIAQRWVLFYVASAAPTILRSKISADFVTWKDGVELTMPHSNVDGRNFAVTRATLGGKDVFHFALSFRVSSTNRRAYVARAVMSGETLAWSAPTVVTSTPVDTSDLDPDGPAIGVSADGFVTLLTGYDTNDPDGGGGTGNAYIFRSSVADDGAAAFTPSWSNLVNLEIVPITCNARAVVPIGQNDLFFVYENGDTQPNPKNLRWSRSTGATWSAELSVFASSDPMDPADWGVYRSADNDVHVVRRKLSGAFEHRRYNGSSMQGGSAIVDDVLENGAGLTLVPLDAPSFGLVGIASSEAVRITTWNGSAWSAWANVLPPTASGTRRWVTSGGGAVGPSALAWTENRGASHVITGVKIR